jgi:outer membrane protein assembly factor BamE (lipoprotein component of BamABCDE complex)
MPPSARPRHLGGRRPQGFPLGLPLGALLAMAISLGGCSFFDAPPVARGHKVTEDQLKELVPGVQSKTDVETLLGSPTARGTFDDNNWYYISATSRYRPMQRESVTDRKVVVVEFDDAGKLKQVHELGEDDGRQINIVSRETPVPGNDRSLLQALFGNMGRFNPLGAAGAGINNTNPGATQPNSTRLY